MATPTVKFKNVKIKAVNMRVMALKNKGGKKWLSQEMRWCKRR